MATLFKVQTGFFDSNEQYYLIARYSEDCWEFESIINILPEDMEVYAFLDKYEPKIKAIKDLRQHIFHDAATKS